MITASQPALGAQALRQLRAIVNGLQAQAGRGVPRGELLALARELGGTAGLTIDFQATPELGQPLIVVRLPDRTRSGEALVGLSARENDVTRLVAQGLSNKQIARTLGISIATVKDHLHRILTKTGCGNRAALAAAYIGAGSTQSA